MSGELEETVMMSNSDSKPIGLLEDGGDRGEFAPDRGAEAAPDLAARRPLPNASHLPRMPVMIADEILDYYGWVFCQGGFRNFQMTFQQFLAVVATLRPSLLQSEDDAENVFSGGVLSQPDGV